jgi:flagellar motor switch protein FliM
MSKVLSQEEVDALLKGLVDGEIEIESNQEDLGDVTTYDFTSQERIIRGRMSTMEVINEHFARAFRISLSMILRRTVDIQTNFLQMLKFGQFLRSLPLPSRAIDALPDKEKLLISLYYYEELTMKEIGQIMGYTESRISQLHTQAMFRLRAKLRDYFQVKEE